MFDLNEVLTGVQTVGIAGHIHPDGDCVGSCLGLYLYVRTCFPQIEAVVHLEQIPEEFRFLSGSDQIDTTEEPDRQYDVFFCLDCGDTGRLGGRAGLLEKARMTVCVDHHITNSLHADKELVDPASSSTSELICDLIGVDHITKEMAEALYMGIAHDTGVFRYDCTSSHTMQLAGELMDKGIAFSRIISTTYFGKSYLQTQILGRALLESILILDKRVVFSALRDRDLKFFGVEHQDLSGIVDQLKNIHGVDAAIFMYESGVQEWRVSMRSNEFMDVAQIASYFGGGGHKKAAGCNMQGSMYDVVNNLTALMEKQLQMIEEEKA